MYLPDEGETVMTNDLNTALTGAKKKRKRGEPKAKRRMREAFLQIRAHKDLEEITVTELCRRADINKSTFYGYYHNIYELSDALQSEVIQQIIDSMDDPSEICTDVSSFAYRMLANCRPNHEIIQTLFSGSQSNKLPEKMDEVIKKLFYSIKPQHLGDLHHAVMLSYKIYGSYYAYIMNTGFDPEERMRYIAELDGSFATHDV